MEYKKFVMLVGVLSTMTAVHVEAAEFKDVPQKHWAFEEVHWLRADGMLEGWGGKFHGKRQFTRYEMAKVLGRYMGKYEKEKAQVEQKLGELRTEDQQQRARLDDLGGRTSALERRLGIQAPRAMASPSEVARASRPATVVVPVNPAPSDGPGAVTPGMVAGPPPSLVAPIETAPTVPVDEAESAAVERLATPEETQPAPQELPLSERIALMRQRLQETRRARPAPGGTGSGAEVAPSTSAPLPGDSIGTGDGRMPAAAPPPAPAADGGLSDDELAARVQAALSDLDSMPSLDGPASAPPPTMESTATRDSASSLSADQSGRYDAIRERYLRLMGSSGSAPPAATPSAPPPPSLPSMTGASSGSSSDFDFQSLPEEGDSQALPGSDSQPLPGMGAGSQPLPGSDDQPLPGMGASIDGVEDDMELPDVGMPGLGYIEGTD